MPLFLYFVVQFFILIFLIIKVFYLNCQVKDFMGYVSYVM